MAYPDVSATLKLTLTWFDGTGNFGSRLFCDFDASPTGAELATFATAVAGFWNTNLAPLTPSPVGLVQVVAEDLTSDTSATGKWTGTHQGTAAATGLPSNCSIDFQAQIAKRYRGGHPVFHHPPPVVAALETNRTFTTGSLASWLTAWNDFIADINAYDTAPLAPVTVVVLLGYKNGALPEAVDTVLIESYAVRTLVGTMRRRLRTAP